MENRFLEKLAEISEDLGHTPRKKKKKFQPVNPKHKGLLHRELGIPENEPISEEILKQVIASADNIHTKRRAQFALNARKWRHTKAAENVPPANQEYSPKGIAVGLLPNNVLESSSLKKEAEKTWTMPLDEVIKEHKDLSKVLKSNDRKAELKELKEQAGELKAMLAKKRESK